MDGKMIGNDEEKDEGLMMVTIPTQTTKALKRKHIRTEFNDELLDKSAFDAQKREKARLERIKAQNSTNDHIAQMEALFVNKTNGTLPELEIKLSDFGSNGESYPVNEQKKNSDHSYHIDLTKIDEKYESNGYPLLNNQPSTSKAEIEVIDLSSDSEIEDVTSYVGPKNYGTQLFAGRRSRWTTPCRNLEDYEKMEKEYSKEQKRVEKMRNIEALESTEKCEGRLLVNSGHPEEDPDVFVAPHLTHILQPHQLGGIRFMYDNTIESLNDYRHSPGLGCILAHSMGLGKTIQVITFSEIFIRTTQAKKVLIIVPINTIQNWYAEYEKWLPKMSETGEKIRTFEVFLLGDSVKTFDQRVNLIEKWHINGGVLLIGYDMFRILMKTSKPKNKKKNRMKLNLNGASSMSSMNSMNDIIDDGEEESSYTNDGRIRKEAQKLLTEALVDPGPELVVCDEGHKIKNLTTEISLALSSIRTKRRIVLTGYPLQNNLLEYYCMIDFVRPKYLGTKKSFCDRFERPIKNGQCVDSTESDIKLARQRTHVLVELVKGFVQRRTHHLLKTILPESKEYVILLRKSDVQRQLYRNFVIYAKNEMKKNNNVTFNPLKAFAACSKIWNHPDILAKMLKDEKEQDEKERIDQFSWNQSDSGSQGLSFDVDASNSSSSGNLMDMWYEGSAAMRKNGASVKGKRKTRLTKRNEDREVEDEDGSIKYDWSLQVFENYKMGLTENGYKMMVALEIIDECTKLGEKILVFSQNLTALALIEEFLTRRTVKLANGDGERWERNRNYLRFDGSTTGSEREKLINRFKSDAGLYAFLISTRAGSLGINLVSANRCIIFDACWNPCHDAQAVCRVYRYGQQRKTYIYRLIMDNSMEKAIFNRQVSKHGLQQRVVDDAQVDAQITHKELETLLVYNEALDVSNHKWDTSDWKLEDELLEKLVLKMSNLMSEKPFLHESLILESEKVLSEEEKKEAQLLFEREKRLEMGSVSSYDYYNSPPPSNPFGEGFSDGNNLMGYSQHVPPLYSPMPQINYYANHANGITVNPNDYGIVNQIPMYRKYRENRNGNQTIRFDAFPGALTAGKMELKEKGFVQDFVTDRPIQLPVIGRRDQLKAIPANTRIQLVRPNTGVYLKLSDNTFLDAAGTIYEQHAINVSNLLSSNERAISQENNSRVPEVIDLD